MHRAHAEASRLVSVHGRGEVEVLGLQSGQGKPARKSKPVLIKNKLLPLPLLACLLTCLMAQMFIFVVTYGWVGGGWVPELQI